ncbi:hypothetical protein M409DRAFT_29836 [Zasmidium cellare ATCC 36951]|uniref:Uncharacterized protein n=1 Tax=Zasmidium cellare ATCC 36951 TaxID=1080233 RepID=A0A6A6C0I5_ZASCE|nr:uncharacterized protein M409DRAFT_29836 [Zasmidium cellare ATCC 36951]KAF2159670.1 hypothetical protein M409DRAFT_29836 [Zasmidium cellare ATCC 36951]
MEGGIVFLTGAPEANSLTWGDSQLTPYFTAPIRRFLGDAVTQDETTQVSTIPASHPLAKWRGVDIPEHERAGEGTTNPKTRGERAQFLSFHDSLDSEHEDFLEYSLAVLQNLESSQIEDADGTFLDETTVLPSTSFSTTASTEYSLTRSEASVSTELPSQQVVTFNGLITDLRRVPNARHLQSIHPQTMTINILAGVISIQAPRTVRVRRSGAEMDIVEVLVGDDTRAGFSISFWLTPVDSQRPFQSVAKDSLRGKLSDLRIGDVILVTHIALSAFRNNVYGQSLSRRITRNNTSLTVLSDHVGGLSGPNATKLEKVRNWTRNFVGKGHRAEDSPEMLRSSTAKRRRSEMELPPDTQF